jgi:ATP-binding cassette subfamily B protein
MRRLYEIAKPERTLILASACTLAVTSSITLLLPYACGNVLDAAVAGGLGDGGRYSPLAISLGLFGLTGMAGLGVYARSRMLNVAGNRIVSRIRRRLFASILSQDSAFFDVNKSGDLISRLANDSWYVKSAMTTEAVSGLRGIVMSAGSTSLLFYTSPTLAMVSLLSIPPVFLMARVVGRRLKEKQNSVQELHGSATNIAEEVFGGMKTVQSFNAQGLEYDRYATSIATAHEGEVDVGNIKAAFDGVVHVAANGAVLLVMGYGGTLVLAGELSAGDLTGFLMYSLLMAGNVSSLSGTYTEIMKSIAAAGRLFEIIDRVPQIPSSFRSTTGDIGSIDGGRSNPFVRGKCKESISIKFDKIGFAYPARPETSVLGPNFILDINAGENIALVGGSGSGKSTISLLLTRLYNLDNGRILLNGKDVLDIDPAIVREQIGVVSQEPLLFSGTIYDNIRYGRPGASHEEVSKQTCSCFIRHTHLRLMLAFRHYGALLQILEAARSAHVTHFTDALPEGLQTQVGSRGTQLR